MKAINFKELGLVELKTEESETIQGGYWWAFVVAYVLVESVLNPVSTYNSFKAGFAAGQAAAE